MSVTTMRELAHRSADRRSRPRRRPPRGVVHTVMSSAANVIEFPVRPADRGREAFEHELVLALATADDLASAMARVVESVGRSSGANSVEWWATGDDGEPRLGAATGIVRGRRHDLPLGAAGALVVHGGRIGPELEAALTTAAPIIRRRAAEERLARTAIDLARRNQALEDYAALVAHELKTPLHAALLAEDPSRHLEDALERVEALLAAARSESSERAFVSVAEPLDQAVEDVGADVDVTTDLQATVPFPAETLRVILRNLLSNAVAAGARHVRVAAVSSPGSWRLLVDDDGIGLGDADRYASGSGLGLSLSRRIIGRFGGVLELGPHPAGGTRAMLEFPKEAQ
jgi:signal transduction histidine kinase